jgi:hypothetical protein
MDKRFNEDQLREAMERLGTTVAVAAELGCAERTVQRYKKEFPALEEAQEIGRKRISEKAISNLAAAIEAGDLNAAKFWLTNSPQGKSLGFGKRDEVTSAVVQMDPTAFGPERPRTWEEARLLYADIKDVVLDEDGTAPTQLPPSPASIAKLADLLGPDR